MCFNRNVSWTEQLKDEWECGIIDPFNECVVGTGMDPVDFKDEDRLQSMIPLSIIEEAKQFNLELMRFNGFQHEFDDLVWDFLDEEAYMEQFPKLNYNKLSEIFQKNSMLIIYNTSIWDNTLKEIFTQERVMKFLNSQLDNLTKSKSDLLDSDEKINIKS